MNSLLYALSSISFDVTKNASDVKYEPVSVWLVKTAGTRALFRLGQAALSQSGRGGAQAHRQVQNAALAAQRQGHNLQDMAASLIRGSTRHSNPATYRQALRSKMDELSSAFRSAGVDNNILRSLTRNQGRGQNINVSMRSANPGQQNVQVARSKADALRKKRRRTPYQRETDAARNPRTGRVQKEFRRRQKLRDQGMDPGPADPSRLGFTGGGGPRPRSGGGGNRPSGGGGGSHQPQPGGGAARENQRTWGWGSSLTAGGLVSGAGLSRIDNQAQARRHGFEQGMRESSFIDHIGNTFGHQGSRGRIQTNIARQTPNLSFGQSIMPGHVRRNYRANA